jgi:hypothetical protein
LFSSPRRAIVLAVATAGVAGGALWTWIATMRWNGETAALERALAASAPAGGVTASDGIDDLPAPVRRYLRMALPAHHAGIRTVRVRQTGRLRTGLGSERWLDFEARQTVAPAARAFVWDARVRVAPLTHVRVRDRYVAGVGAGQVALQSTLALSDERGGHDLNSGDLFRLLAEAPWCPVLLLPAPDLTWTAIDDRRALAEMRHGGERVSVEFRFDHSDGIVGVFAAARPRQSGGGYVPTPWEGHFGRYETVQGVRIPRTGEVGWWVDGRWTAVWQGSVAEIVFDTP